MTVETNEQLKGQLVVIGLQAVADNQRLSQNTLLAYQKDLFQGAQGETPQLFATIAAGDKTPTAPPSS